MMMQESYTANTTNNKGGNDNNNNPKNNPNNMIKPMKQQQQQQMQRKEQEQQQQPAAAVAKSNNNNDNNAGDDGDDNGKPIQYNKWLKLAIDLAGLSAKDMINELITNDPFNVRQFDKAIVDAESKKGALLTLDEIQSLFTCPKSIDRITLPDQRNPERSMNYKNNVPGTFLFFQHLRKAGGTNFCSLAEKNLPKQNIPKYYCMPDYHWPKNHGCAGCLHQFTNDIISSNMEKDHMRIAGNEWDNFNRLQHFQLKGAVFATSFRKPLDRAISQFRFECIEDRGCKFKQIEPWWEKRKDLYNIYTRTFSDYPGGGLVQVFRGNKPQHAKKRQIMIKDALDTVIQFDLVTSMEWLAYSGSMITNVLGFQDTSSVTKRVRPHIKQYQRNDGQDENKLGAAGIAKASYVAETYLTKEQYTIMQQDLALDELLTDAARRIFLERLVC